MGANRLDDRIVELNDVLTGIENRFIVRTVMVDSIGDVTLCFDNGAVWSILVDTSGGEECWRYLPANEEQPQLVACATNPTWLPTAGNSHSAPGKPAHPAPDCVRLLG